MAYLLSYVVRHSTLRGSAPGCVYRSVQAEYDLRMGLGISQALRFVASDLGPRMRGVECELEHPSGYEITKLRGLLWHVVVIEIGVYGVAT